MQDTKQQPEPDRRTDRPGAPTKGDPVFRGGDAGGPGDARAVVGSDANRKPGLTRPSHLADSPDQVKAIQQTRGDEDPDSAQSDPARREVDLGQVPTVHRKDGS